MGFLGKLKFWKKEDEFGDLGKGLGFDQGEYGAGSGNDLGLGQDDIGMQASNTGMPSDSWGEQQPTASGGFGGSQAGQPAQQQGYQARAPQQQSQSPGPGFEKPTLVQQEGSAGFGSRDYSLQQSFEVLSAKLDALKAGIDAMNQRLATLEREMRHKKW